MELTGEILPSDRQAVAILEEARRARVRFERALAHA